VQALTETIFPCYAEADGESARQVAAFLERGADVRVFLEEGRMWRGQDLATKAREARTADTVLVFFSRQSMPSRWPRAQWEDALVKEPAAEGVRIAFLRCDDCVPPKVLAPLFEMNGLPVAGMRALKRWVRRRPAPGPRTGGHGTDVEVLGLALADRPGSDVAPNVELALEFAEAFRDDFDAVARVECGGRSLTALAGDLGSQLGLRLEGDLEGNLARLREFCAARRLLVILADAGAAGPAWDMVFGGRCSTLLVEGPSGDAAAVDELAAAQRAMAAAATDADWSGICWLARLGRKLTRDAGRLAECFELMEQWHGAAQSRGDRRVVDEAAREMVWILEAWGRTDEAGRLDYRRASECDEQMMLPF